MQCSRCQIENRTGRRFCAECGAPLALPCASCGFANEPGEKFCGGCGTPLTAAPRSSEPQMPSPQAYIPAHLAEKIVTARPVLAGERKQVTVLFADLKDSVVAGSRAVCTQNLDPFRVDASRGSGYLYIARQFFARSADLKIYTPVGASLPASMAALRRLTGISNARPRTKKTTSESMAIR